MPTTIHNLSWAAAQQFRTDKLTFFQQAAQQHGGVARFRLLWMTIVAISDPDIVHDLLVNHPLAMVRDPYAGAVMGRLTGRGVFMAEGVDWKRQRKLVQPAFHALRIQAYVATMRDYTTAMVAGWQPGATRPLHRDLTELTLRIIANTMFGIDLAGWTARLGGLMQTILAESEHQLENGTVPPTWWPGPGNRRQLHALAQVRDLLRDIIHKKQAHGHDDGDLLSLLLAARDDDGQPMTESQLLDECLTLLVAGHETTAVALTWALALLTRHPDVLGQLQAELDSTLHGAPVTFADLKNLPYLEMVVKETLRLYPPAWSFSRTPLADFTVRGETFRKGDILMISPYVMHRSAHYFADPDAFRPARFAADDAPGAPAHPYAYLPFGGGPRICVGNQFALLEMRVILATLLQHVTLTLPDETAPLIPRTLVTLQPVGGLHLSVHPQPARVEAATSP